MFFNYLIIIAVVVLFSIIFLGFNIFFLKKDFPDTHVGHNPNIKKMGITCVKHEEIRLHGRNKKKLKINPKEIKIVQS